MSVTRPSDRERAHDALLKAAVAVDVIGADDTDPVVPEAVRTQLAATLEVLADLCDTGTGVIEVSQTVAELAAVIDACWTMGLFEEQP
jgi:hypothetical protein